MSTCFIQRVIVPDRTLTKCAVPCQSSADSGLCLSPQPSGLIFACVSGGSVLKGMALGVVALALCYCCCLCEPWTYTVQTSLYRGQTGNHQSASIKPYQSSIQKHVSVLMIEKKVKVVPKTGSEQISLFRVCSTKGSYFFLAFLPLFWRIFIFFCRIFVAFYFVWVFL